MVEDIQLIETQAALEAYCRQLSKVSVFALDTEFMRIHTFYPKPGLFQINDGERIVLIDPLTIDDWQAFSAILVDPNICKVLHACDEDIELLVHFLKIEPQNIFDTQFVAALCGDDFSLSYQVLIKQLLDVDIEKDHRRSDWRKRPLSPEQLHYAADDVRYLLPIYHLLKAKLEQQGKQVIMASHYQEIVANLLSDDYSDAYHRVKEAWRLDAAQFARLKQLAAWREQTMRKKNLPRNRIATNEALMQLATQQHWNSYQLFAVEGLSAPIVKGEGDAIIAMLAAIAPNGDYQQVMAKPHKDKLSAQIKKQLQLVAQQTGIHESLLSKRNYNLVLKQQIEQSEAELSCVIQGWRKPFYQAVMDNICHEKNRQVRA